MDIYTAVKWLYLLENDDLAVRSKGCWFIVSPSYDGGFVVSKLDPYDGMDEETILNKYYEHASRVELPDFDPNDVFKSINEIFNQIDFEDALALFMLLYTSPTFHEIKCKNNAEVWRQNLPMGIKAYALLAHLNKHPVGAIKAVNEHTKRYSYLTYQVCNGDDILKLALRISFTYPDSFSWYDAVVPAENVVEMFVDFEPQTFKSFNSIPIPWCNTALESRITDYLSYEWAESVFLAKVTADVNALLQNKKSEFLV